MLPGPRPVRSEPNGLRAGIVNGLAIELAVALVIWLAVKL
jgi:hypothetical protein